VSAAPLLRQRAQPRERLVITLLSVSSILVAWAVLPAIGVLDAKYTSQPHKVVAAGIDLVRDGGFHTHVWLSLQEFAIGFALAAVLGVAVGLLMGYSRTLRELLDPLMMALHAAPRLALLPIIIVWLGIGMSSKIAVVFIGAVIPIVVNAMAGIAECDPKLLQVARSLGARRRDVILQVLLPFSVPSIMTGLRLGLGRGLLGVIVGEMYVSTAGLGYLIRLYGGSFRTDRLIFLVVLVAMFGYACTSLLQRAQRSLSGWKEA
jgi:ABC-type nitrate/sulfonate/bicarbonate transport system permease component